ncbi:MAG: DUF4365 domain-containing protein [Clostridia bacterium]|nr:DUF4365 domain-containing protein [Clostridia bacterium]
MPNLIWTQLKHLQLGEIAENYAKIEFLSFGFEVYDTVVDDRGIDFIARKNEQFYEVQVKAVRNRNYTFIAESKMEKLSDNRLVCFINFEDFSMPKIYVIPSTEWRGENPALVYKTYAGLKSEPEWGINFSKKNEELFKDYLADTVLKAL